MYNQSSNNQITFSNNQQIAQPLAYPQLQSFQHSPALNEPLMQGYSQYSQPPLQPQSQTIYHIQPQVQIQPQIYQQQLLSQISYENSRNRSKILCLSFTIIVENVFCSIFWLSLMHTVVAFLYWLMISQLILWVVLLIISLIKCSSSVSSSAQILQLNSLNPIAPLAIPSTKLLKILKILFVTSMIAYLIIGLVLVFVQIGTGDRWFEIGLVFVFFIELLFLLPRLIAIAVSNCGGAPQRTVFIQTGNQGIIQ